MRISKSQQISDILSERVKRGTYSSTLPGAPGLAKEFGVTQVTIYKTLDALVKKGILIRNKNGRVSPANISESLRVVYLTSGGTFTFDRWLKAVRETALSLGCSFKTVTYQYPDDPVVFNTLNSDDFDLIFIFNYGTFTKIPLIYSRLLEIADKVVSLFYDDTKNHVRMLDGYEDDAMGVLADFMLKNSRGKTGFLSNGSQRSLSRIAAAAKILKKSRRLGEIHHIEVPPIRHSADTAYSAMKELLANNAYKDHGVIICSSVEMTIGAAKALRENKIRVPEDITLASFGNPELAKMQNPPIPVVTTPDPQPLVKEIFKQFLNNSNDMKNLKFTANIPADDPESIIFKG